HRDQIGLGADVLGGGVDQHGGGDPVGDLIGVAAGPGLHGDAAHAVADEHGAAAVRESGVEDGGQIVGEGLIAGRHPAEAGIAVPALVVGDHAETVGQRVDLRVPVLDAAAPAVDEHDDLAIGGAVAADPQAGAVDGGDVGLLRRAGRP